MRSALVSVSMDIFPLRLWFDCDQNKVVFGENGRGASFLWVVLKKGEDPQPKSDLFVPYTIDHDPIFKARPQDI